MRSGVKINSNLVGASRLAWLQKRRRGYVPLATKAVQIGRINFRPPKMCGGSQSDRTGFGALKSRYFGIVDTPLAGARLRGGSRPEPHTALVWTLSKTSEKAQALDRDQLPAQSVEAAHTRPSPGSKHDG